MKCPGLPGFIYSLSYDTYYIYYTTQALINIIYHRLKYNISMVTLDKFFCFSCCFAGQGSITFLEVF